MTKGIVCKIISIELYDLQCKKKLPRFKIQFATLYKTYLSKEIEK